MDQPRLSIRLRFAGAIEGWHGLDLRDYVIYELHIGTFTPQGTFDSAIGKLEYLKQLGDHRG